jgi:uncharacterized protein with PIN domain
LRFVVDVMLGKLAKWLKILGFDTEFSPRADDDDLLAVARRDGRTLLSRDRALLQRAKGLPHLLIDSENWEDQIRQVLARFRLRDAVRPHTRCLECNAALKPLTKDQAAKLVPAFVLQNADSFALCLSCGRIFWPGTHFDAMSSKLADLLADDKT